MSQVFLAVHFPQNIIFEYDQGEFRDFEDLIKRNAGYCDIHTWCGNHSSVFPFSGVLCV